VPNWTANKLEVCGLKDDCEKFLNHMGEEMDFEKVIPMPENCFTDNLGEKERKRCEDEGIPNWLDWCSENWGTKWNASRTVPVERSEVGRLLILTYCFSTAWDTPKEIITALWKQWPDLEFEGGYVHEGYEGCGSFYEFSNRE
jgi:hypothetical protein